MTLFGRKGTPCASHLVERWNISFFRWSALRYGGRWRCSGGRWRCSAVHKLLQFFLKFLHVASQKETARRRTTEAASPLHLELSFSFKCKWSFSFKCEWWWWWRWWQPHEKTFRRGQGGFCSARAIQNWRALGSCRSEPAVEAECLGRAASEWQFSFSLPHPHGQAVRQRPIVEGIKAWEDIHLLHGHRRLLLELDSLPGGTLCK